MRKRIGNKGWFALGLALAAMLWTRADARVTGPPLFTDSDVPGFFLHESRRVSNAFSDIPFTQFYELWMTIPRAAWLQAVDEGHSDAPRQTIVVRRAVFSNQKDALEYAEEVYAPNSKPLSEDHARWRPGSPSGTTIGDKCWYAIATDMVGPEYTQHLNHDSLLMLTVSRGTVLHMFVKGTPTKPVDRNWAEQLIRRAVAKLSETPPLEVEAVVLSKHVKPHKNEKVLIRISSNSYPASYRLDITRQSKLVYQTQIGSQSGPYLFTWDGYTNAAQQASNGSHDVLIVATDAAGRTATRSVKVVVNFQGP